MDLCALSQYLAPYVGCAVAEYYRDRGQHALVVFDDLSTHGLVYGQLSKRLYEADINLRFMHGPLLERAGITSPELGGGYVEDDGVECCNGLRAPLTLRLSLGMLLHTGR